MELRFLRLALLISLCPLVAPAQNDSTSSGTGFNLGTGGYGISFGNSPRHTGLRFNWSDNCLEEINGVNVTLWKPGECVTGAVNGLAVGVIAPAADEFNGIAIGIGGVMAKSRLSGISFGGLGVVSEGDITGITLAGLGTVSKGDLQGISIGGLGCVSQGSIVGGSFALLGLVGKGDVTGISIGGLGTVAGGTMTGMNFGGLGLVGKEGMYGVNIGGMGTVSQGVVGGLNFGGLAIVGQQGVAGVNLSGMAIVATEGSAGFLNLSGLAVVGLGGIYGVSVAGAGIVSKNDIAGLNLTIGDLRTDGSIAGLSVAGYRTKADRLTGIGITLVTTQVGEMQGAVTGVYNRFDRSMSGLSIGFVNDAASLFGVQLGFINIADNNPFPFRVLPILNVHF